MTRTQYVFQSKIGKIYLIASEKGLQSILFTKKNRTLTTQVSTSKKVDQILKDTVTQLTEYFSGKRKKFNLKLDLQGTAFQNQVWKELLNIPFGKTLSYKDVAQNIQKPKAVRAVGTANGRNPICIVIPCHRVIAADGTMGGYSGGLPLKKKLLALESLHS